MNGSSAKAYIVAVWAWIAQFFPSTLGDASALVGITLGLVQLCITVPKAWKLIRGLGKK